MDRPARTAQERRMKLPGTARNSVLRCKQRRKHMEWCIHTARYRPRQRLRPRELGSVIMRGSVFTVHTPRPMWVLYTFYFIGIGLVLAIGVGQCKWTIKEPWANSYFSVDPPQFQHQLVRRMVAKDLSSRSKHDVNIYYIYGWWQKKP